METTKSTYTVFLSKANFDLLKKDTDYTIIRSKQCAFIPKVVYYIAEIQVNSESPEDLEPENILDGVGALALHEDGSNCFLVLESDLTELETLFDWDGAASMLMSELLTAEDKVNLLYQDTKHYSEGDKVWLNVGTRESAIWRLIENATDHMFLDTTFQYRFGDINSHNAEIWWPILLDSVGGFYFVIQKETPEEEEEEKFLFPVVRQPNPYDPKDNAYFLDPEDYNYNRRFGGK